MNHPQRTRPPFAKGRRPVAHGVLALVVAAAACSQSAVGRTVEPLQRIGDTARTFLESTLAQANLPGRIEIQVNRIDRRLKLPRCERDLVGFLPHATRRLGNMTVGVRCEGRHPWKLFVTARVREYRPVVVARRPLAKGARLGPGDLEIAERDVTRLRGGYVEEPARLTGKTLKRDLSRGAVLHHKVVRTPKAIRRGQRVVLLASAGGLEVRMEGRALSDAAVGERCRVRNLRSSRVVEGRVTAGGVVRVRI